MDINDRVKTPVKQNANNRKTDVSPIVLPKQNLMKRNGSIQKLNDQSALGYNYNNDTDDQSLKNNRSITPVTGSNVKNQRNNRNQNLSSATKGSLYYYEKGKNNDVKQKLAYEWKNIFRTLT